MICFLHNAEHFGRYGRSNFIEVFTASFLDSKEGFLHEFPVELFDTFLDLNVETSWP